ncbi:hypothetical protein GHT06_022106 [Daphnia sinensis]|uniref:SET domain-containing protein n=1 Tax=Daphnia sinensis TaxID=1820382 RepID=A0AAD5KWH9_9CRUS|nr:hypothetical protein GHT06_022106 [Daphnia sinensis]
MSGLIITSVPLPPSIGTACPSDGLLYESSPPTAELKAAEPTVGSSYKIGQSPHIGRLLIATRDICADEVIIDSEEALAVGPKQATHPVCLNCYRRVDGSYLCPLCQWPLCSEACWQSENGHHQRYECELLASKQVHPTIEELKQDDCRLYDCIAPMRIVLDSHRNPERNRLWLGLEDHRMYRKKIGIWQIDKHTVVDPVREKWQLGDRFDDEELQRACGILEVNAFEVCDEDKSISARAVYSHACLMAHDCVPNTACTVNPATQKMTVRAAVDISAGQMITTSYTFTLDGTLRRRAHLKETKFFDCCCPRCSDPTELGSHLSSLACPRCSGRNYTVPEDPLNPESYWKCLGEQCGNRIGPTQVSQLLTCLQRKADELNYDDTRGLEIFIETWSSILHPNHSILIGIKYYLCHFYGNAPGYQLHQLPLHLLVRKIKLCEELLGVALILEPGASNFHCSLIRELELTEKELARGQMSEEDTETTDFEDDNQP